MPWGCGEQNMVYFAPNIYVLKYLQTVNQLTKQLETKAKQYMVSGWCSYAVDWKKKTSNFILPKKTELSGVEDTRLSSMCRCDVGL